MQPFVIWSESIDFIFITIDVNNIIKENIDIKENELIIDTSTSNDDYHISIKLLNPIRINESGYRKNNKLNIYLKKREAIHWKNLSSAKDSRITYDWDKYLIEDDDELLIEELSDGEILYETSESESEHDEIYES